MIVPYYPCSAILNYNCSITFHYLPLELASKCRPEYYQVKHAKGSDQFHSVFVALLPEGN